MCGIVGYVGCNQATPILLNALEKLEYRGYDSAGIAIYENKIKVFKDTKKIAELRNDINKLNLNSNVGIGHTRWATHGKPTIENAHPHLSENGKFAIVHNGIIENYIPLKEELLSAGFKFKSDTDTEVVANLLEFYYNENFFETVKKVLSVVEGSYGIAIMCSDFPSELIVAKQDSPLIIGLGKGENFIASDISAIVDKTRDVVRLCDGELAVITPNSIEYFDKKFSKISKEICHVDWTILSAEKNGYDHFMMKEIMEQPNAIKATFCPRIIDEKINIPQLNISKEELEGIKKICIIGCGSAYHVGCIAKYIFEKTLKIQTDVEIASEFRYKDPLIDESVMVIAISQSGETADTLAAVKEAKSKGAKVLAIVNVVGSSIANEADVVVPTFAGPEIAVATTKAYSTQLTVIYMLAIYMAEKLGKISSNEYESFIKDLKALPRKAELVLKDLDKIKKLAQDFCNCKNIFFIGRNVDYAVALEGALKAKEISYIHSEAYAAGELKHGTISLVEDGTFVVALATNADLFEKMISNIREVKARGAVVLLVTAEKLAKTQNVADFVFYVPETNKMMQPSMTVLPLQILSYYLALYKGCDIDKPRNLAKSVTVE
mgnify:FL=1